jgi:hypothetical protein
MCTPWISQVTVSGPKLTGSVHTFNANTNKRIDNTFLVALAESRDRYVPVLDGEQASIAGVPGRAAPILLDFVSPSGARTGQLLPSGRPLDTAHPSSRGPLAQGRLSRLPSRCHESYGIHQRPGSTCRARDSLRRGGLLRRPRCRGHPRACPTGRRAAYGPRSVGSGAAQNRCA